MAKIAASLLHCLPVRNKRYAADVEMYESDMHYADTVYVEDKPTHTWWLDVDGEPYEIYYDPVGFDLSGR